MEPVLHPVLPLPSSPFESVSTSERKEEGKNDEGVFFKLRIFFYAYQAKKGNAVAALIRQGVRCHEFRRFNRKDAVSALHGTLNSAMYICILAEESRCGPC